MNARSFGVIPRQAMLFFGFDVGIVGGKRTKNIFALIFEGRGVTQSRVAQLALTDLSLVPHHFTYSCDTRVKCLG